MGNPSNQPPCPASPSPSDKLFACSLNLSLSLSLEGPWNVCYLGILQTPRFPWGCGLTTFLMRRLYVDALNGHYLIAGPWHRAFSALPKI